MNTIRLQVILNHADPEIVSKGLDEFRNQILEDHGLVSSFGYMGRGDSLMGTTPIALCGVLKSYYTSSPDMEEFYALWSLPNRDEHRDFCASHTAAVAAILYCTQSDLDLSVRLSTRMIKDHAKAINNQLDSGHTNVIHATLGLIKSMCQLSSQICKDTFLKVISLSEHFGNLSKPGGKVIRWVNKSNPLQSYETDSRFLVIVILMQLLSYGDNDLCEQLSLPRSLWRRVASSLDKDIESAQEYLLNGVISVIRLSSVPISTKLNLVDSRFIVKIIELHRRYDEIEENNYNNEVDKNDEVGEGTPQQKPSGTSTVLQTFLHEYCNLLSMSSRQANNSPSARITLSSVRGRLAQLLKLLHGHTKTLHKELQVRLLRVQPELLSLCISSMAVQWDPRPDPAWQYLRALAHLAFLLDEVDVDPVIKRKIKQATSNHNGDEEIQGLVHSLVTSLLPNGLTKKEFMKILLHRQHIVQELGLKAFLALLHRIRRSIASAVGGTGRLESFLRASLTSLLPDFQILINLRSRFMKELDTTNDPSSAIVSSATLAVKDANDVVSNAAAPVQDDDLEDDIQLNLEGFELTMDISSNLTLGGGNVGDAATAAALQSLTGVNATTKSDPIDSDDDMLARKRIRTQRLISLLISVLQEYLTVAPTALAEGGFDLLRLLDDVIHWDTSQSSTESLESLRSELAEKSFFDMVSSTLNVLRLATMTDVICSCCRWLGSKDQFVKLFCNLLVSTSWCTYRRSAFSKLLLLCACDDDAISNSASAILREVFNTSGLFEAHGMVEVEMAVERVTWTALIRTGPEAALLATEICLRMAYHWNSEICTWAASIVRGAHQDNSQSSDVLRTLMKDGKIALPFTPVLLSSFLLCNSNFSIIYNELPKNIRSNLSPPVNESSTQSVTLKLADGEESSIESDARPIASSTLKAPSPFQEKYQLGFGKALIEFTESFLIQFLRYLPDKRGSAQVLLNFADDCASPIEVQFEVNVRSISSSLRRLVKFAEGDLPSTLLKQTTPSGVGQLRKAGREVVHEDAMHRDVGAGDIPTLDTQIFISNLSSLLNTLPLIVKVPSRSLPPSVISCISKCWNFIVFVYLSHEYSTSLSPAFMAWITQCFMQEAELTLRAGHADNYLVQLVSSLSLLNDFSNSVHRESEATPEGLADLLVLFENNVIQLFKVMKNHVYFDLLLFHWKLFSNCLNQSVVGKCTLRIIVSLASIQGMNDTATHGKESSISKFWCNVSAILVNADENLLTSDADVFRLAWFVQGLVADSHQLRSRISSIMLHNIALIDSMWKGGDAEEWKLREGSSQSPVAIVLDPMCSFIVRTSELAVTLDTMWSICKSSSRKLYKASSSMSAPILSALTTLSFEIESTVSQSSRISSLGVGFICKPATWVAQGLQEIQPAISHDSMQLMSVTFTNAVVRNAAFAIDPIYINVNDHLESEVLFASYSKYFELSVSLMTSYYRAYSKNTYDSDLKDFLAAIKFLKPRTCSKLYYDIRDIRDMLSRFGVDVESESVSKSESELEFQSGSSILNQVIYLLERIRTIESTAMVGILFRLVHSSICKVDNFLASTLSIIEFGFICLLTISSSLDDSGLHDWLSLYHTCLHSTIFGIVHGLPDLDQSFSPTDVDKSGSFQRLFTKLVRLPLPENYSGDSITGILCRSQLVIRKNTQDKLFRTLTDKLFQSAMNVHGLADLLSAISVSACDGCSAFKLIIDKGTLFDPPFTLPEIWINILKSIATESKLIDLFLANSKSDKLARLWLLQLILILVVTIFNSSWSSSLIKQKGKSTRHPHGFEDVKADLAKIFREIWSFYTGTLSLSDRLIFRISYLLHNAGVCADPTSMPLQSASKDRNKDSGRALPRAVVGEAWLFAVVNAPQVYATLAQFPFERTTIPSPFAIEYTLPMTPSNATRVQIDASVELIWTHGPNSQDGQDYVDSDTAADCCHDTWHSSHEKTYDPGFWVPALLHFLNGADISVRQIANCGMLSLVIATLGCESVAIRTYALTCLQLIYEQVKKQTPDVDVTFRERPQLLLLLNFIRNSFAGCDEVVDNPGSTCPSISPLVAIFLARSAMHLLQHGHELYGKINKYLLSRPFSDAKDAPLYDLLVTEGDSQDETTERLAVLRLLRDGLLSRDCHLNLCRKNAYNRLMLLFPILAKDVRTGHAILDLFDKALGLRIAARYLLERSSMICWIEQMAVPVLNTTKKRKSTFMDDKEVSDAIQLDRGQSPVGDELNVRGVEYEAAAGVATNDIHESYSNALMCPRLLSRFIALLRRVIGAAHLLSGEGVAAGAVLARAAAVTGTFLGDVIKLSRPEHSDRLGGGVSEEVYRQLILCMWDCALSVKACGSAEHNFEWTLSQILSLVECLLSCKSINGVGRNEMLLSVLSLAGFGTSHKRTTKNIIEELRRYLELVSTLTIGMIIPKDWTPSTGLLKIDNKNSINIGDKGDEVFVHPGDDSATVDSTSLYFSIVHVLERDTRVQSGHGNGVIGRAIEPEAIENLLSRSWREFAHLSLEKSVLPAKLNFKLMMVLMLKGVLNQMCKLSRSYLDSPDFSVRHLDIVQVRCFILIHEVLFGSNCNIIGGMNSTFKDSDEVLRLAGCRSKINHKIIAYVDCGFHADYESVFCDYQLLFRLTILCILSVVGNENLNLSGDIANVLSDVYHTLTASSLEMRQDTKYSDYLAHLKSRGDDELSGTRIWSTSIDRTGLLELCQLTIEVISSLIMTHDLPAAHQRTLDDTHDPSQITDKFFRQSCLRLHSLNRQVNPQSIPTQPVITTPSDEVVMVISNSDWNDGGRPPCLPIWQTASQPSQSRLASQVDARFAVDANNAAELPHNDLLSVKPTVQVPGSAKKRSLRKLAWQPLHSSVLKPLAPSKRQRPLR